MKNLIVLALFSVLLFLNGFGQEKSFPVDVTKGPEGKLSKRTKIVNTVGSDKTGFYVLQKNVGFNGYGVADFIVRYDNKMNPVQTEKLTSEFEGNPLTVKMVLQVKEQIFLISTFKNGKIKKGYLFAQSLNKSTLKVNDDIKKIGEIDIKGEKYWESTLLSYQFSEDKSKIMIYYDLFFEKIDARRMGVHVIDSNLDQLWEKKVTLPYEEVFFTFENLLVDNNGTAHITGNLYEKDWNERKKFMPKRKFLILSYKGVDADPIECPVELENLYLGESKIIVNTIQNTIYCGGFYSLYSENGRKGSYFLKIDMDSKKIISQSKKEISRDFIVRELTELEEKKAKKNAAPGEEIGVYQLALNTIVLMDDGSVMLLGDRFYTERVVNVNAFEHVTINEYFRDIIVSKINSDGKIVWTEVISKSEGRSIEGLLNHTYFYTEVNDQAYFVFNDSPLEPANIDHGLPEPKKGDDLGFIVTVRISTDGKQMRRPIFDTFDAEYMAMSQIKDKVFSFVAVQPSANEVIFLGNKGKTHRFIKLAFE